MCKILFRFKSFQNLARMICKIQQISAYFICVGLFKYYEHLLIYFVFKNYFYNK